MGRFGRCISDAGTDVDADWVGILRVYQDETLAAAVADAQSGVQMRMTTTLNATHVGRAMANEDGTEPRRSKLN